MAELTKRQESDINSILYFIPEVYKEVSITFEDIESFILKSEKGVGENVSMNYNPTGYQALLQGKRWREWHMRAWEEGVLGGTNPYILLIDETIPIWVFEYMKKSMFSGVDRDLMDKVYSGFYD